MFEASLQDIQAAYFDGLEQLFGGPFSEMKEHNADCAEIAADLASRANIIKAFQADSEEFFGNLIDFWDRYRDTVDRKIMELTSLKAVFGGDLSPSYTHNIAASTGLYMDTIVIPDPVLRIADFRSYLKPKDLLYLTAKHALNALTYRELALADVQPPIVVIISDPLAADPVRVDHLKRLADGDLRAHLGKVFGRSFDSEDELSVFLAQFSSLEEVAVAVRDSSRVLFDLDWPDNVVEQTKRHLSSTGSRFREDKRALFEGRQPGVLIADLLRGRLMQTNDIVGSSQRLEGTPIVDAPTSWQYLLWKYEYDIARSGTEPTSSTNLLVARALQGASEDDRLRVLRTTPEVLISLRRNGVLEELREMLRTGIRGITLASPSDLEYVTDAIAANIESAMLDHQRKLDALVSSGIRWYGLEVAPLVVSASISILGAATGNIPLSTIGAVTNALGLATVKDAVKHAKSMASEYKSLRRSAAGILFRNL